MAVPFADSNFLALALWNSVCGLDLHTNVSSCTAYARADLCIDVLLGDCLVAECAELLRGWRLDGVAGRDVRLRPVLVLAAHAVRGCAQLTSRPR